MPPCNGCQALRGQYKELTSSVTITATGFAIQELLRVTIPPLSDPVELEAIVRPASLLTGTTVGMQSGLAPAGATTLSSLDYDNRLLIPFTDVNQAGHYTRLHAWVETPGDYVLYCTKVSGNGQAVANSIASTRLWWRR